MMTGRDMIKWIQDNKAEDLPVMIKRGKNEQKEMITKEDLEITVKISGDENQGQYKKYFLI